MKKIILMSTVLFFGLFGSAQANNKNHSEQAIEHANTAIVHGSSGHSVILVEHLEESLKHTKNFSESVIGESKTHSDAAINALNNAIVHGRVGHSEEAIKLVEQALVHLKELKI
jgi:hypothetical protein